MPYIRLVVHTVWAVKDRNPMMSKAHKDALCRHIKENARKKTSKSLLLTAG